MGRDPLSMAAAFFGHRSIWIMLPLFFVTLTLLRLSSLPLMEDHDSGVDDWILYAQHARDIVENGILMPTVQEDYVIPAGFLYNYFIAFWMFLFPDDLRPVFLCHSLLLGLSVVLLHKALLLDIPARAAAVSMAVLCMVAFVDVHRNYTHQLFSENLALFLVCAFLFVARTRILEGKFRSILLAALLLATAFLTRPNLALFTVIGMMLLAYHVVRQGRAGLVVMSLLLFAVVFSLLAVRNYLITGNITFLPMSGDALDYFIRNNPSSLEEGIFPFLFFYVKQTLFTLGALPVLVPEYNFRPHWVLLWGGAIYLSWTTLAGKERPPWLFLLVLFLITFFGTLILVAPLHIYGYRMLVPGLLPLAAMSILGWTKLLKQRQLERCRSPLPMTNRPKTTKYRQSMDKTCISSVAWVGWIVDQSL
jgi:hypothetical protein